MYCINPSHNLARGAYLAMGFEKTGSLQSITAKLQKLHEMLMTPPPGALDADSVSSYTPLDRLRLLKEVTDDARVFRLGGEDKIRVATSTCETVSDNVELPGIAPCRCH